ncbi:MAG TPA: hypothetical protein VIY51_24575 [Xanthobacteraceae bacterium]
MNALRRLEASLQSHFCEQLAAELGGDHDLQTCLAPFRLARLPWWQRLWDWPGDLFRGRPKLKKVSIAAAGLVGLAVVGMLGLWWRLASGPIDLDLATPWLTAAIEENFGSYHRVKVGGTQIERDANGRTALRMRDIVVRDPDGTIVATAPKAEIGLSGAGLLSGHMRAERLSLVGAEMAVRIEPDSKITVFAGANNKRPFVTASAGEIPVQLDGSPLPRTADPAITATTPGLAKGAMTAKSAPVGAPAIPDFAALLAWLDGLGATGLDGHELSELGLKSGNLTVDDQRDGKQWSFHDINLSLTRPKSGGIALTLSSAATEPPWLLRAALTPGAYGHRFIDIETQKLPAKDMMLAMRLAGPYELDVPLSGRIRADIGPEGIPTAIDGRIVAERGFLLDLDDPPAKIAVDRAEFTLDWDGQRNALNVPFHIESGGNRVTLLAKVDAPRERGGNWGVDVSGGTVVLASAALADPNPLILNRFQLRLKVDAEKQRIDVLQGDIGNTEVGLAVSGNLDYSTSDPRLTLGVAGNRMSVAAMKRLWLFCVAPKVRNWVLDHVSSGTVERMAIATNAPLSTLRTTGPPIPDDGLSIEIVGSGVEVRPVDGLPPIRDADLTLKVGGRKATVSLGRGNVELSPGHKFAMTGGVFEVPDTFPTAPPARARFRLDGPVQAAAELLSLERLRDFSGSPLDPATSRGNLSAQVSVGLPLKEDLPPGSSIYTINIDVANFAADRMVMGQKVEAQSLHVVANNQGYWIKGDVKLNGVPAALDYRKPRGDGDAEVRIQATLDEAARSKLGFDLAGYVSGPVPVKVNGRVAAFEGGESRFAIDADLTPSRIDGLLPGWSKPSGKSAHATFTVVRGPQSTRFDDVAIDGPGSSVKGAIELDDNNQVASANFPTFSLSEGDKTTLKAERGPDGALRVMMRGDVYDGRNFVKLAMAGPVAGGSKQEARDVDLDVKVGTVVGFHGETLRGLDLTMSRRGGAIKSLAVSAKLGRDAALSGDLRGGRNGGRQVIYVNAKDAGAFFRFTDMYAKIFGGEMFVAMDPVSGDVSTQEGLLNIADFSVRGEAALDRVVAGAPGGQRPGVDFSRMRVEFTRSLGRFAVREGIVSGPMIGATVEGYIDYLKDDVRMRGTFIPLYGLNNMFGQIPLFGIFLGGGAKEGLVGVTYEVVGPVSGPTLHVNPISAVTPGLLRKFFEFPNGAGQIPTSGSSQFPGLDGPVPPGSVPQVYGDPVR